MALIQAIWLAAAAVSAGVLGAELDTATLTTTTTAVTVAAADAGAPQMFAFREATARVLEATHGWINCLLSARPRPPPEITRCTEQALPAVADILVALSTAGWAIRYKSTEELDAVRRTIQRMADVRTQVHSCVEGLSPQLQVAGRCYTVL